MPQLVGGAGKTKEATPEVQKICDDVRSAVEEKIGKSPEEFTAVIFRSQVVAGINYFVKVSIGGGSFLHLRVYKDLKGSLSLHGLQKNKLEIDELEYFDASSS